MRSKLHWSRIVSILTVLFLCLTFLLISMSSGAGAIELYGTFNATSFGIYLLLILFALGSILSVYGSLISNKPGVSKSGRIYTSIVSWSSLVATIYLTYFGIIGWMMWAN